MLKKLIKKCLIIKEPLYLLLKSLEVTNLFFVYISYEGIINLHI